MKNRGLTGGYFLIRGPAKQEPARLTQSQYGPGGWTYPSGKKRAKTVSFDDLALLFSYWDCGKINATPEGVKTWRHICLTFGLR